MSNDRGGRPSPRSGNPRRALVVRGNEPCNRDTVSIVAIHQTTTSISQPASPINDSTLPIDQSPLSIHQSATSIFHSALPIVHPVAWIHHSDFEIAPFVGVRYSFDFTNSHDISADRSSHDAVVHSILSIHPFAQAIYHRTTWIEHRPSADLRSASRIDLSASPIAQSVASIEHCDAFSHLYGEFLVQHRVQPSAKSVPAT